jgi:four helix bundle protein
MKDIEVRTFEFALRIVRVCKALDETPGLPRMVSRQLFRSGTSIGANIREAQAGQSRPDFISKNSIALKEAHETSYWLALLAKSDILPPERLHDVTKECGEINAILTAIVKHARENWKREKGK